MFLVVYNPTIEVGEIKINEKFSTQNKRSIKIKDSLGREIEVLLVGTVEQLSFVEPGDLTDPEHLPESLKRQAD